jgi:tetratricopeptide (TPR) repeat protein
MFSVRTTSRLVWVLLAAVTLVLTTRVDDLVAQGQGPPSNALTLFHLAEEARYHGDASTAEVWLRHAVELDPDATTLRLEWASVLLQLGRTETAAEALSELLDTIHELELDQPERAASYHRLQAIVASQRGDHDAAIELYERAARFAPRDIRLRFQLIGLHRARGSIEGTLTHLKTAADLRPQSVELRVEIGRLTLALEQWSEAEGHFRTVVAMDAVNTGAWQGLGQALVAQGRLAAGEEALLTGIAEIPESAPLHEQLGDVLYEQDRLEAALAAYRKAAQLTPAGSSDLQAKIDRAEAALIE